MPIDASARHVFAYDGSALQMADEHTMVTLAGNALQFTSTVTQSQHFLLRNKPRKVLAFDVNWRNSEIAVTSRDPNPEILIYSYPDKKLRGKLQNGATMEYIHLTYSRCGRRLLTLRLEDSPRANTTGGVPSAAAVLKRLCVWDMEKLEPLKGCGSSAVAINVVFASFDPSNSDHFLLGGDDSLQLWKIYKGKASYMLRHVAIKLTQWVVKGTKDSQSMPDRSVSMGDQQDLDEKRCQFVCCSWMRHGQVLVANRAGELVMVDTVATASGSELTGVILASATRANRCCIVGIVYTSETIVVAYADGLIAWLNESEGELLQTVMLPCYARSSALATGPALDPTANVMATLTPSPHYSKVYAGTVHGHIYELKVNVALDDDEEMDDDMNNNPLAGSHQRASDDPSMVASRLISSCGSFHRGSVFAATVLTPSGGTLANDLVIASGGTSGRIYLWSISKCRSVGETNVVGLFAVGASALITNANASSISADGAVDAGAQSSITTTTPNNATLATLSPPPLLSNATAAASPHAGDETCQSDESSGMVITALVARPADPVLLIGDQTGKLRALCIAKIVGGNGALEFLPLHSIQLLPTNCVLDLLELHPSQPFVLAASTTDRMIFVLSLDHEKHFSVLAYVTLPMAEERVLDVKWSVPPHSPAALSFTFLATSGKLYMARHQDASGSSSSSSSNGGQAPLPIQLKPKIIAYGDELTHKCATLRFLSDAPVNTMIAVSPTSCDLLLLKYADLVVDPNEKVPLQAKILAQDAHDAPGIAALAVYGQRLRNGEELIATAGLNGAITIWVLSFSGSSALQTGELHLEDVQASKKKTLTPHLGAITSMTFVSCGSDSSEIYLVTTGVDGCVYLLDVRVTSDMLGLAKPEPSMSPLYMTVANFAKYEDPFKPESDLPTRPFVHVLHEELEIAARSKFDRLKDKTRANLNELEMKLKILLAENDKLPESEQLQRDEFVVNTAWRDHIKRKNGDRAASVRDGILRDLAKMNIVRERMKLEFWDSASVPGVKLRGLTPANTTGGGSGNGGGTGVSNLVVYNFPMRRQSKSDLLKMKRMELLRLIEYEHQKHELQTASSSSGSSSATATTPVNTSRLRQQSANRSRTPEPPQQTSTTRFQDVIVPGLQWLIGAGLHHPSLNRWVSDKLKPSTTTTAAGAAPGAPGVTGPAGAKDSKMTTTASEAATTTAGAATTTVITSGSSLLMPAPPATLNDTKSFHLVYHPAAIKTTKQQRIQIQLLKWYVRFLLVEFNREFHDLQKVKETKMDEIEAKNARICEITTELGHSHAGNDLFRPKWAFDERADSILQVTSDEMTQSPYESEDVRRQKQKQELEKQELQKQLQKDDVAGRALQDMMDGTLEVKKENLVTQVLVKEPWMLETPVDEMTSDQKKLIAQFEMAQQKLKEEQDKIKKSLDLEWKKIKAEIVEICKQFDDKIRTLQDISMAMKMSVSTQQLYELCLAQDLMENEHLETESGSQKREISLLEAEIRIYEKENDVFAGQVDAWKEEWHKAMEEDRLCEKSFLRELEETVGVHGVVVEHEQVKHLVEMYKKRKGDDVRIGGGGAGPGGVGGGTSGTGGAGGGAPGVGGPKRGKSNLHLNAASSGGGSKHRLLAEAGQQSSRTLAATALLQNLQSSSAGGGAGGGGGGGHQDGGGGMAMEGEQNFDPFLGVDMPPPISLVMAKSNNGPPSQGAAAAGGVMVMARHVVPLDYETDRPDGVMIDDRVWRALNELRTKKILAEHTVREKADAFATAKAVADEFRTKLHELQQSHETKIAALDHTTQRLCALGENAPLLVHIKQGQDETSGSCDDIFRNAMMMGNSTNSTTSQHHPEALLVARASVESLNDVIQLHGKDQVGILGKIKNFRKNINVMEWEHTLLEQQTRDMEERYTDIQLLRVTKDLQALFHTGDTSEKQKREFALLEAKMDHLGKHHQGHLIKLDTAQTKLDKQLRDRVRENHTFASQVAQLEMQVQIREDILHSRKSAALRNASTTSGGGQDAGEAGNARLKAITVRRKLVDLARAQTEEIEFLRMELDKMRRRTFPTFAQQHAAAHPYGGGGGNGVDSLY